MEGNKDNRKNNANFLCIQIVNDLDFGISSVNWFSG
jgi:hypothetical protein